MRKAISPFFKKMESELAFALCLNANIEPKPTTRDEERFLDSARGRYGARGVNLLDAAREILSVQRLQHPRNSRDLIEGAFFSGAIGTDVLDETVTTALTAGFSSVDDTAAGWTSTRECKSFRTERRTHVKAGDNLERLPKGGTAAHDVLDLESAEQYNCCRYARQLTVDLTDLAGNCNLPAVLEKVRSLGEAAQRTRLDLVFGTLLANAALDADSVALFHADHSNLNAGSALTSTTLRDGVAAMMKQQEGNISVNPIPRFLICPPDLALTGAELLRNLSLPSGRNLTLISDARLANGVTDPASGTAYAGSTSSWYLSASGAQAPTVEVGYVDSPKPQLSSWTKTGEDGQWLIGWSVKLDIGAKVLSYLGLQRNDS